MNRKLIFSVLLGTAISTGGMYLALRNIPFADLVDYLAAINYLWIAPAALIVVFSFVLRVLRWQIILASTKNVAFWPAFHALMIAFMINTILPGRVGELARPAILKNNQGVKYSTGLATVATERVFDIAMIIILFFMVMSLYRLDQDTNIAFGGYLLNAETLASTITGFAWLGMALLVGIVLISINASRNWINRMILRTPALALFFLSEDLQKGVTEKVSMRVVALVENFAAGFKTIKSPAKIAACLFLSMLVWGFALLSYYVFAKGCPGIDINLIEMTAVMVIISIFIALPSVPGYWGLWEAGGIFALTLFNIPGKEAAGFTLANHAVQMLPVMIIGAVSAWVTGVNIWRTSFSS